jgi:hypothetical protein
MSREIVWVTRAAAGSAPFFIFDLRFGHYLRLENICAHTQLGGGGGQRQPPSEFFSRMSV